MAYTGKSFDLGDRTAVMGEEDLLRAAAKYGRAVAHVVRMYRHILAKNISLRVGSVVDETETPTRLLEHVYIATELKRLGVEWVSLAPRFVGRFEKGVDYIGDLAAFRRDIEGHAAVAQALGRTSSACTPGSDKFSIYPSRTRCAGGVLHVKTAGTSYLEALRVAAQTSPALFRQISGAGHSSATKMTARPITFRPTWAKCRARPICATPSCPLCWINSTRARSST